MKLPSYMEGVISRLCHACGGYKSTWDGTIEVEASDIRLLVSHVYEATAHYPELPPETLRALEGIAYLLQGHKGVEFLQTTVEAGGLKDGAPRLAMPAPE